MKKKGAFASDPKKVIDELGKETVLDCLKQMLLIRNFENRGEQAYQQGKVGGFYHSYIGQEAIAPAAVQAMGKDHWWGGTYRCHGTLLCLGAKPNEMMAELYGRANGNSHGRGGSMHMYLDNFLGGFGVVGGQIPIMGGAAFSIKYQGIKDKIAVCFLGDGATAQGSFHESLNLASKWDLPVLYIVENNNWGIGTNVGRVICVDKLAEDRAPAYGMKGYTVDGMDFFSCYSAFKQCLSDVINDGRPVIIEALTERFRGHSVSDPGLYRSKEQLQKIMESDPLLVMKKHLIDVKLIDEEKYKAMDKEQRDIVVEAMKHAESSPWPDPVVLEDGVYA